MHHCSPQDLNAESHNYHPLDRDWIAVSRTLYGVKEISGRGGFQVVTRALVLPRDQLAGYAYQVFRFTRVARSLGHLRWKPKFVERLPVVELPDTEESEELLSSRFKEPPIGELGSAMQLLRHGHRVALVGATPELAEEVVDSLSETERALCSFSTGLKASSQRPYHLQVFSSVSAKTLWRLQSNSIHVVSVGAKQTIN